MFAMPVVLLFLGTTLSWPVNGVLFDWASTASVSPTLKWQLNHKQACLVMNKK